MLNKIKNNVKKIKDNETVKDLSGKAKDLAIEEAKSQIDNVKTTIKWYVYGGLTILGLIIIGISIGIYKLLTM